MRYSRMPVAFLQGTKMDRSTTPSNKLLQRLKQNPWASAAIAFGTVVIAIASFTDASAKLWELATSRSSDRARAELSRLSIDYSADAFVQRAEAGDLQATKLFLLAGIGPDALNSKDSTALDAAVRADQLAVAQLLLEGKANVNHRLWTGGTTTLVVAASRGSRAEIIDALIEAGADEASVRDAAHAAARRGHHDNLRLLLDRRPGAGVRSSSNETLLNAAALGGDLKSVKLVLERGAALNEKGAGGKTALHVAAERGHEDIVWLLLTAANVQAGDHVGRTPLHLAAGDGHAAVVRALLEAGAQADVRCNCPGDLGGDATALIMASREGHTDVVRALLSDKVDVNAKSKDGSTPLLLAADTCGIGGGEDLVELLLENGADVNGRSPGTGRTPLMQAQRLPCVDAMRVLLDRGADASVKDNEGWTAAMYALTGGSAKALQLLLDRGAPLPPDSKMPDGLTPRQWVVVNIPAQQQATFNLLIDRRHLAASKNRN